MKNYNSHSKEDFSKIYAKWMDNIKRGQQKSNIFAVSNSVFGDEQGLMTNSCQKTELC